MALGNCYHKKNQSEAHDYTFHMEACKKLFDTTSYKVV